MAVSNPCGGPGQRRFAATLSHLQMKTFVATPANRERNWVIVDATGQTLGRLATQLADALRGKRKPEYTPHCDVGDFVIVVNAEKVSVTGNKRQEKRYYRHSGFPGGLRSRTFEEMIQRRPEEVLRLAVKGMLPRSRLGRQQLRKLKIYAGPDHPHQAQQPPVMEGGARWPTKSSSLRLRAASLLPRRPALLPPRHKRIRKAVGATPRRS